MKTLEQIEQDIKSFNWEFTSGTLEEWQAWIREQNEIKLAMREHPLVKVRELLYLIPSNHRDNFIFALTHTHYAEGHVV